MSVGAFIEAEKAEFGVATVCRALGVARSGVIAARKRGPSVRAQANVALAQDIRRVENENQQRYGSPRIFHQLQNEGHTVSENRIARLMKAEGIAAKQPKRFVSTTDSKHDFPVAPNVLDRQFAASAPNQAWVGDITYLWCEEGWLYLAVLIDLYSRRVVGWAALPTLEAELPLLALERALALREPPRNFVHHTDRGSNYASTTYDNALFAAGATVSMSRTGNCWDNAPAESFFATLKRELTDSFPSRSEALRQLTDYMNYYNYKRLHSTINYMTPVQFELANINQLAA